MDKMCKIRSVAKWSGESKECDEMLNVLLSLGLIFYHSDGVCLNGGGLGDDVLT